MIRAASSPISPVANAAATAGNLAGNTSLCSQPVSFTNDQTPPPAPTGLTTSPPAGSTTAVTITGNAETTKAPEPRADRPASASPLATEGAPVETGGIPRWVKIAVMSIIIIGCNATAAWLLLRPPTIIGPKYTLMTPADSATLLVKVAGEYRTGSAEGDRRIVIDTGGTALVARFGANLAVVQPLTKPIRGALVDGQPALVTDDPAAITLKDADTIVYYGNTYKRHNP